VRRKDVSTVSRSFEQIGRNYKPHLNSIMLAVSVRPITDVLRKRVVMFHPACPHSSIQTLGWVDGANLGACLPGLVPQALANAIGGRAYGYWLTTEDGSSSDNRVIDVEGALYPTLDYHAARLPEGTTEHQAYAA
jgi:hypothetical protein